MASANSNSAAAETNAGERPKTNEKLPCTVCNLTFANSCILESHLAGKRHQKKMRSLNLGGIAKETTATEGTSSGLTVIGQFYCNDCGIYANSSSQLDVHMKSNKHILKVEQKASGTNAQSSDGVNTLKKKAKSGDGRGSPAKKAKSDGPAETYKCTLCDVETNSKTQYEQHMVSNRHKNRENPQFNTPVASDGLSSRKRKGAAFMAKKRQSRLGLGYDQPLSSSFVSGGSYDNQQQHVQQMQQPSNMSLLYGRAKQYSAAMMYQQQGGYKGMKQNDYNYGSDMNGSNKADNEGYRNMYNRSNSMAQGGFNNMNSKKSYYGSDDPYSGYGQMGNQSMNNSQYNLPSMSYNNSSVKSSFSLW